MNNLYLIGFMGAGKSAVGAALAEIENTKCIEMDQQIEEEQGIPIRAIFEQYGEPHFRDLETSLLERLAKEPGPLIVSCGGGVVLRPENVRIMKENGQIILLTAAPGTILERVKDSMQRPLLNGHMEESFIAALMEKRRPFYEAAADRIIVTDGRTVEEICREIRQI